jgi:hypothetical protein
MKTMRFAEALVRGDMHGVRGERQAAVAVLVGVINPLAPVAESFSGRGDTGMMRKQCVRMGRNPTESGWQWRDARPNRSKSEP